MAELPTALQTASDAVPLSGGALLEVAADWHPAARSDVAQPARITRDVALPTALSDRRCLVVQGVRRCGKSTLLRQLPERYALDAERCLFINFEDPRLAGALTWPTLDALADAFDEAVGTGAPRTLFLDEIQHVEGWQRWLRSQLDRPAGRQVVVSGSNAHLLSGELGSSLTGRHLTVELYPFSLPEAQRLRPELTLRQWLTTGGFPEALLDPDGALLVRQTFSDIVERDVRERVAARSSRALRQVAQMVFEAAGSELSARRLAAAAGVATDTVLGWLDALEAAYLCFRVPRFAWSERKRSHGPTKWYPIDTGMRRLVSTPTGADRGKGLEAAVHLALRRRFGPVTHWREGDAEVDFVIQRGHAVLPIQVTWDEPQPRHQRGLDVFYGRFPTALDAVFITAEAFEQDPNIEDLPLSPSV